ncbi:MAG: glutamine synthetase, partial [Prevotella sp.]|nr:glutamine synthetase [Prevotella sp.]
LCVACRHGFEMENALEVAEQNYVDVNIHAAANASRLDQLAQLPDSCSASAACLQKQRSIYEQYGVFSPAMIDGIIAQLRSFDDETLRADIQGNEEKIEKLVKQYFHCG